MTSEQLMQMSLVSWVTNQGIGAAPTDPPIWWNISADHLLLSPPQTHQTIRKPTSQEELDLCCYQKCGFQPFQHPSLQLPKGLSAPDPPPLWCRKRKQFFKGVQIWNYKMRGVRTMHVCAYSVFGGGRLWKSAKRNFLFQPKPTKQGSQRWNNGC